MKNVYEIDGVLIRDSKEGFAARKARILAARAKSDAKKHMQQKAMREEFDSLADMPEDGEIIIAGVKVREVAPLPPHMVYRKPSAEPLFKLVRKNNDHEDDGA